MLEGRAREGRGRLQGIGLALGRAEGAAEDIGRDIRRHAFQLAAIEPSDIEAMGPLDRHLALDVPSLRLGRGEKNPAADGDFEVGAELGFEPGPQPDRIDQQGHGRREGPGPGLALGHEGLMRDLGVQAAGIGAGGLGIEVVALDERRLHAVAGEVIGRGDAGEPAADDQDVGSHRAGTASDGRGGCPHSACALSIQ